MIIIGGANGAGKTTFVKKYLEENKNIIYLSADAIAEEISPGDLNGARIEAGRIFLERIDALIRKGENILVESTLSGKGLSKYILKAREVGNATSLIYVFHESVDVCINRVNERVLAGGHYVPKEDIIRRYYRSLHNFWDLYKNMVDDWYLMYNSNIDLILACIGKKEQQLSIVNQELYKIFEKVINEAN